MAEVGGGRDKDAYTRGDKHKGGWLRASERAGIRGGPSYIDFCPRHHHTPAVPPQPPASHPTEQEAAAAAGVGRARRGRGWRDGEMEVERVEWRWRVRDRRGRGGGRERQAERRVSVLAALSTGEALGGGTLSHSTPPVQRRHPLLPPHSNNRHRCFGG